MEDSVIEEVVEIFYPDNKSIKEIIELFGKIVDSLFEDNIFNYGRLVVIERFANRIIERSHHLDTIALSALLKDHTKCAREKINNV